MGGEVLAPALPVRGALGIARFAGIGVAFIAAYVALDWISFLNDYSGLGITPWNPQPGLSLAFLLRFGLSYGAWLWPAALVAEIVVRGVAASPVLLVAAAAAIAATYWAAAWTLRRICHVDPELPRLKDTALLLTVGGAAALIAGLLYVGLFLAAERVPHADFGEALMRFAVGDFVGIAVTTPTLLRWLPPTAEARRSPLLLCAGLAAVMLTAWIVFGLESTDAFKFFYLLFLPVVPIALRFGLDGAALALLAAELSVVVLVQLRGFQAATVTEFQALLLALTVVGLLIGAVVSERRRIERALAASEQSVRERQTELAHVARLATTGEMAAQLAHELNQPLSALRTYTRAADRLVAGDPPDVPRARQAMADAVAQADRAGAIIRRLRDFVRKREVNAMPIELGLLVSDAVALVRPEAARFGAEITLDIPESSSRVRADTVQIGQVLVNLLRNAIDAVTSRPRREIAVGALLRAGYAEIVVRDSGPGVPAELRTRLFEPFASNKPEGMGLGLSISRSIVEAHGGRLWLASSDEDGAEFRFTLPFQDAAP